MKIRAALVGLGAVSERLQKADVPLKAEMRKAISRAAVMLVAAIKMKLSDDVLHVRTGTLRRSVGYKIVEDDSGIAAIVGTNLVYGAVHEFGFHGPEQVKAYNRRVTKAFGRPLTKPTIARVRAHTRNVNFPERSFVRTSLSENLEQIRVEVEQSAKAATSEIFNG